MTTVPPPETGRVFHRSGPHKVGGYLYLVVDTMLPDGKVEYANGYIAAEGVTDQMLEVTFTALEDQVNNRLDNPDRELQELRALFALQWTRMSAATARWRAEDPAARAAVLPDLGVLLDWLMAAADRHGPYCPGTPTETEPAP